MANAPLANAKIRSGVSLMELIVVMTIVGVLISMSVPKFHRILEQSQADLAGANLGAIWSAQRLYWLDERTYSSNLMELQELDLLDRMTVNETGLYRYEISFATADSFVATATRVGSTCWSGQLAINEQGVVQGQLQADGHPDIAPGFQ